MCKTGWTQTSSLVRTASLITKCGTDSDGPKQKKKNKGPSSMTWGAHWFRVTEHSLKEQFSKASRPPRRDSTLTSTVSQGLNGPFLRDRSLGLTKISVKTPVLPAEGISSHCGVIIIIIVLLQLRHTPKHCTRTHGKRERETKWRIFCLVLLGKIDSICIFLTLLHLKWNLSYKLKFQQGTVVRHTFNFQVWRDLPAILSQCF